MQEMGLEDRKADVNHRAHREPRGIKKDFTEDRATQRGLWYVVGKRLRGDGSKEREQHV